MGRNAGRDPGPPGFETATLGVQDLDNQSLVFSKASGIRPEWRASFESHIPEISARTHELLAEWRSLDDPLVLTRQYPPATLAASPYYREGLLAAGLVDVMQFFLMTSDRRQSALAMARSREQGPVTDREIALGRLLVPHIRRALSISDLLANRKAEQNRLIEALDALRCGVLLIDERGAVRHANRAAGAMLTQGRLLTSSRGRIEGCQPDAARRLREALREVTHSPATPGRAGIAIPLAEPGETPVFAHVVPLGLGDPAVRLEPGANAAIFVSAASDDRQAAEMIAVSFGLTPGEQRVLDALLEGRTLVDAARELGVAATTARTHLKHIFLKTGVSRQSDLMRLIGRLPGG